MSKISLFQNLVIQSSLRAEDGAQTRDPQLGRLMLYQLSYFRRKNSLGNFYFNISNFNFQKFKIIFFEILKYSNFEINFCGQ